MIAIVILVLLIVVGILVEIYRSSDISNNYDIIERRSTIFGWACYILAFSLGFASYFFSWWLFFVYGFLASCFALPKNGEETYMPWTNIEIKEFGFFTCISAAIAIVPYALFQVWWFFLGDDYFNGGLFALAETPSELFCYTIMLLVAILYFASFFILKK